MNITPLWSDPAWNELIVMESTRSLNYKFIILHNLLVFFPFFLAEVFTDSIRKYVGLAETIRGFQ